MASSAFRTSVCSLDSGNSASRSRSALRKVGLLAASLLTTVTLNGWAQTAPAPAAAPDKEPPPAQVVPPISGQANGQISGQMSGQISGQISGQTNGQTSPPAAVPGAPGPTVAAGQDWCSLPLCREAEGLRRSGDLQGALKLYRYIQDEVDVDEKVVRKPLLFFTIASLCLELDQAQAGLDALQKYQQYIESQPDAELPAGHRRADVERLGQELRAHLSRLRVLGRTVGLHIVVDGKEAGVTPLKGPVPVFPGRHRIEIVGAQTETQEIEVAASQEVQIWPLQPARATAARSEKGDSSDGIDSSREPRPRWRLAVGAVGIGVGVTMIGVGAAALAADGRCANGAAAGACPVTVGSSGQPTIQLVDGRGTGAGLLAVGILASAAGTVLVALPGKRRPVQAALSFSSGATLNLASLF